MMAEILSLEKIDRGKYYKHIAKKAARNDKNTWFRCWEVLESSMEFSNFRPGGNQGPAPRNLTLPSTGTTYYPITARPWMDYCML